MKWKTMKLSEVPRVILINFLLTESPKTNKLLIQVLKENKVLIYIYLKQHSLYIH